MSKSELNFDIDVDVVYNGLIDKKNPPDYVTIDGHVFERVSAKTIKLELDFDASTRNLLDQMVATGKYINIQDVVRSALRAKLEEPRTVEPKRKSKKKTRK
jgi:Arc/MetJ-type ribon-helix-helix transcriptional regulator